MLYMEPQPDKVLELRRVLFSVSRKGGSARNADPRQVVRSPMFAVHHRCCTTRLNTEPRRFQQFNVFSELAKKSESRGWIRLFLPLSASRLLLCYTSLQVLPPLEDQRLQRGLLLSSHDFVYEFGT